MAYTFAVHCSVSLSRVGALVIARCAEFPDCVGRGATREEALRHLRDSVTFWLEAYPCDQTAAPGLVFDVRSEE